MYCQRRHTDTLRSYATGWEVAASKDILYYDAALLVMRGRRQEDESG